MEFSISTIDLTPQPLAFRSLSNCSILSGVNVFMYCINASATSTNND